MTVKEKGYKVPIKDEMGRKSKVNATIKGSASKFKDKLKGDDDDLLKP